ncbi:helix-turn-helix transcriptional regulator [Nocardia sp. NPDC004068]|uniref:helix-turn-helix transcriptional regulator n=1 Tax=Nocardia sp. NPDC004068 TaxID=3364303 RepID=UPI0036780880
MLIGVGVSWYTWLEQGRDITVSVEVLDAVARALALGDAERAHLYLLAGVNPPPVVPEFTAEIDVEVREILDGERRPAVLRDLYWNVLGYNDFAREVFGFGAGPDNCLITFFTNPRYLTVPEQWRAAAPGVVAAYRADAAHAPDDPGFTQVIDELRSASVDFATLWDRHEVGVPARATNTLHHPVAGLLSFTATTLTPADDPTRRLVLYTPRSGTETAARLETLELRQSA